MRICFPLTTRGNYAKVKSTLRALRSHRDCQPLVLVGGALLLERYGDFEALIESDGFEIAGRIPYIVDGETLSDMTQSAARCTAEMGRELERLAPDMTFVVADRYEALSLAQASMCMSTPLAHLEGGEASGSIDDRIRHAVSMLSDLHFPATEGARRVLRARGVCEERIFVVGTPSLDELSHTNLDDRADLAGTLEALGTGDVIDLDRPYIVVSQHPVVTEYEDAPRQFTETADAVHGIGLPTVWVLPNLDAGAQELIAPVNALAEDPSAPRLRTVGALPFSAYAKLLRGACCLVGNTSSALREGAFLGVPAVNVGSRQVNRERGANVEEAGYDSREIVAATARQIGHGRYPTDTLYGDGRSGERIAEILSAQAAAMEMHLSPAA